MELQWETIQLSKDLLSRTDRLQVYGGWLVKMLSVVTVVEDGVKRTEVKVTSDFISDPVHHWICDPVQQLPEKGVDIPRVPPKKVAKK